MVITGMGVIAPNGLTLNDFWTSIRDGISGVKETSRYDVSKMRVKVSAEVRNFDLARYTDDVRAQKKDLSVQYGLAAAIMAVQDAGLEVQEMNPDRIGIVEGTTTSGASNLLAIQESLNNQKPIHPYNAIGGYCGEGSSTIGIKLGILGHALTCCSGCASGSDALGYGLRAIRDDDADVMVAGGSDAIFPAQHYGFARLRAMSELPGLPGTQMRPFDKTRDGFILGEGAAFFVLEEMGHALSRNAKIYAELISHGRSCESYHPTDPHPEAVGYISAMRRALHRANMTGEEVHYINAHGSATPKNDPLETRAIHKVLGRHARDVGISASKPITGHTMGASGAVEAMVCALAIYHAEMPPTINLLTPDQGCDLDYLPSRSRPYPIKVAMNLNAGFGGRYSCLLFGRHG